MIGKLDCEESRLLCRGGEAEEPGNCEVEKFKI